MNTFTFPLLKEQMAEYFNPSFTLDIMEQIEFPYRVCTQYINLFLPSAENDVRYYRPARSMRNFTSRYNTKYDYTSKRDILPTLHK